MVKKLIKKLWIRDLVFHGTICLILVTNFPPRTHYLLIAEDSGFGGATAPFLTVDCLR